ncbi:MAG: 6-carboxytetrahydropterin synthase [Rikenellaceae bacterium]|nr:6-carboxytetrahydropterin synthase [Rikenellaceae bacterium]
MAVIRLTKEFSFEAAHALEGYEGPCRNIHGHSYRLFVTIKGEPSEDPADPNRGMVFDFGRLKQIVHEEVVDRLDHALMLEDTPSCSLCSQLPEELPNLVRLNYRPTCEHLLADFAARIAARLPEGVMLYSLRLHETATSFAEWYAEDNA